MDLATDTQLARLLHGDCLQVLKDFGQLVDAVVTDPPYHLTSIVKRFGAADAAPAKVGKTGAFARASAGFMGQTWDGGDIAQRPETWRLVFDVMKPGAHLVAFSGTRTYHRMACAIEDAGFEIRDQLGWMYGTGFPKSHAVDVEGFDGWGTALKPAWEPICLARRPLSEKTVDANVAKWGTGGVNIGSCRVEGAKPATTRGASSKASSMVGTLGAQGRIEDDGNGRFPANVIHDGSDEVLAAFPNAPGQLARSRNDGSAQGNSVYGAMKHGGPVVEPRGDSGSAARFFYCAKASKADRNGSDHPTVKPIALIRYLTRLVTPPGGVVLDPFAGSGTTGQAALEEGFNVTLVEREAKFFADIERRIGRWHDNYVLG